MNAITRYLVVVAIIAYSLVLYAGPADWCTIVAFDAQRYESMIWERVHPPCE